MLSSCYITGARVLSKGELARLNVTVEDGVVTGLSSAYDNEKDLPVVDASGLLALPGFIDVHTHGAAGYDVNAADVEGLRTIGRVIDELGGVDIAFGGIGITGHLAFNEPQPELSCEEFAALETRTLDIHPETRATNSVGDLGGALEDMPHRCVTIGMREILGARKVRLGVFRDWHRGVVRRAAYGEPTAAFPATLLQSHPDAKIYVNDVARHQAY